MKETITITETVQKQETISLTCDCCGTVVDGEHTSDIETWTHDFGYGSSMDGDRITFELCDVCYENWTKTFVHPPQTTLGY